MPTCILHIGMPKTGSTSIQDFLFSQLSDSGFHYGHFGIQNGSLGLKLLFGGSDFPGMNNLSIKRKIVQEDNPRIRETYRRQLEHHVRFAVEKEAVLVLSAESLWNFDRSSWSRVRDFLVDRSFDIRVLGYIRARKSWMESRFQEKLKERANNEFEQMMYRKDALQYRERIEALDDLFGREQVGIRLLDPASLVRGCVVQDFCQYAGIHCPEDLSVRKNQAMRLPAIRLLYAYCRFYDSLPRREGRPVRNYRFHNRLKKLGGPPLRFHSELVAPLLAQHEAERSWIEQRLGVPFERDLRRDDAGPCIRREADLFDFDPEALDWLAEQTASRPVKPLRGESAARAVAVQMCLLDDQLV